MHLPDGGVAFFDSGIGGLTVLARCKKLLPTQIFYYFGDNTHAPYGNLSTRQIKRYVFSAFEEFSRWGVRAAVVACNTATAVCIEELRRRFSFPIIGVEPAVFPAAVMGGEIYVLSTRATYESERFRRLCQRAAVKFPLSSIKPFACDGLAGAIEKHITDSNYDFIPFLPRGKPKTVVLGCTHYAYLTEQIADFYRCEVLDGGEGAAKRLQKILQNRENAPPLDHLQPPMGERGYFYPQTETKAPLNGVVGEGQIFFVGEGKVVNKSIFEQMFV